MQARLRAQLGDRSKYSGERRRRSVVVASIVLTITDPLRGSYLLWRNLQAALIRSCGASFACMELTIISRFQRLQASARFLVHSSFFSAIDFNGTLMNCIYKQTNIVVRITICYFPIYFRRIVVCLKLYSFDCEILSGRAPASCNCSRTY